MGPIAPVISLSRKQADPLSKLPAQGGIGSRVPRLRCLWALPSPLCASPPPSQTQTPRCVLIPLEQQDWGQGASRRTLAAGRDHYPHPCRAFPWLHGSFSLTSELPQLQMWGTEICLQGSRGSNKTNPKGGTQCLILILTLGLSFSSSPPSLSSVDSAWPRPGQSAGWGLHQRATPAKPHPPQDCRDGPPRHPALCHLPPAACLPRLRLQDSLPLPGDRVHPAWGHRRQQAQSECLCRRADSQPSRGWGSWLEPRSLPCVIQ